MKLHWKLFGLFLAILTDAASGLIITHCAIKIADCNANMLTYIFGMLFALLPDFDIMLAKLKLWEKPIDSSHRNSIFHCPIALMSATYLILVCFPLFPFTVAGVCLLVHYIHDSLDSGGIRWFWPFKKISYQLFYKNGSKRYLLSKWPPNKVHVQYMTLEDWLKKYYLKLTFQSAFSVIIFTIAIMLIALW